MLSLVPALAIAFSQTAPAASPLDVLKPFEGTWKGTFKAGTTTMDIDLSWVRFGGHWSELSYTYTRGTVKLDYRVMITPNTAGDGFKVWAFGVDAKEPQPYTGKMEGGVFSSIRTEKDPLVVGFSLDKDKQLIMTVTTRTEPPTEIGRAVMKRVGG